MTRVGRRPLELWALLLWRLAAVLDPPKKGAPAGRQAPHKDRGLGASSASAADSRLDGEANASG